MRMPAHVMSECCTPCTVHASLSVRPEHGGYGTSQARAASCILPWRLRLGIGVAVQGKGAVLRQCAWLLQLAALQLHRADLAVLAHREDCRRLLASLYDVAPAAADAGTALLPQLHLSLSMTLL